MSELHTIEAILEAAIRRRRWQFAWRGLWQGLLMGSAVFLLALILFKVAPVPWATVSIAGLIAVSLAGIGFLAGWFKKITRTEMARWIDLQQGLKERLSTALEVAGDNRASHWRDLLIQDAAQHIKGFTPERIMPFTLPTMARWCALLLALAAGLGLVPEYRSVKHLEAQRDAQNIKATAQKLAEVNKRNLETRPPVLETTQKTMDAVSELAASLAKSPFTRAEAVKQVDNTIEKVQKQMGDLTQNPGMKKLDQAAREPTRSSGNSANSGDTQKKMDELEKRLGNAAGKADELQKMKDALQQAKTKAEGMPGKDTPEGAAAREQLSQALADLAQKARDMGQPLAGLEEAIAALEADKTDFLVRDLNAAIKDLDKLEKMAQSLQQMQQQAAGKLGKDLAEQLKNGQAEAAIRTLNNMIKQLKEGTMTSEQMKKILQEVSQAVKPAEEYGKVADELAKAVESMSKDQKSQAAQNLDTAAQELKKLMDQLGDCESLNGTLEALRRAGVCISQCQGWGQSGRNGRPGYKEGGKGGYGVGTWANEEGWLTYPEQRDDLWDNSGINRPDLDARGLTEREQNRPDNLAPTKVRGQISPGSSMPSITLKGVSIKGTSNVKYEEAATAAQTEAQSALNQDQVPRAYRNTVKDYFDDLKK